MSRIEPLRARLLGAPAFSFRGQALEVRSKKLFGMLVYLAMQGGSAGRDEVSELFWGVGKLQSVRQALHELRKLEGADTWSSTEGTLELVVDCDAAAFAQAVETAAYGDAIALWPADDDSLSSWQQLRLKDAPAFNDWLEVERARLLGLYQTALLQRSLELEESRQPRAGLELIDRLLRHDPVNETAYRAAMRFEYARGNSEAAFARYETCRRVLHEELGVEPLVETEALAQEILSRLHRNPTFAKALLPTPETTFVGRAAELLAVEQGLETGRLLTITGPGGIGKTRLALSAATEGAERWADGVVFVPLAGLDDATLMATRVLESLRIERDDREPNEQLLLALRDKQVLLVVDNLEHLLADSDLLIDLLENAPDLKLLVTSREALGIHGEKVVALAGLSLDDAVRLFVERASSASPGFTADTAGLAELVTFLGGHPLALELSAAWVGTMSPAELLDDIRGNLAALGTRAYGPLEQPGELGTGADGPTGGDQGPTSAPRNPEGHDLGERHQSLRATFDLSWSLLSDEQRAVIAQVSTFRGGFDRRAAEVVAGAAMRTLLALVNKSLLRRSDSGRFEMLEVVRQYAHSRLDDAYAVGERHAHHFALQAAELAPQLADHRRQTALATVTRESDNLRLAWRLALEGGRDEQLDLLLGALFWYWQVRGHTHEAERALAAARAAIDEERAPLLADKLRTRHAFFLHRLNHTREAAALARESLSSLEKGEAHTEVVLALNLLGAIHFMQDAPEASKDAYDRALKLASEHHDAPGKVMALDGLGTTAFAQADYPAAQRFNEQSLEHARQLGDPFWVTRCLKNLGLSFAVQNEHQRARPLMEESVELSREIGDQRALAGSLNNLARLEQVTGNPRESIAYLRECAEIRQNIGDRWGAALAQCNMGAALHELGELDAAQHQLEQALELFGEIGNRSGLALAHNRLGFLAQSQDALHVARRHHHQALRLADDVNEPVQVHNALRGLAYVLAQDGAHTEAVRLLTMLEKSDSTSAGTLQEMKSEVARMKTLLSAEAYSTAREAGDAWAIVDAVATYLAPDHDRDHDALHL